MSSDSIKQRLAQLNQRIEAITSSNITLVAVSKLHGTDKIMEALQADHRVFGENR